MTRTRKRYPRLFIHMERDHTGAAHWIVTRYHGPRDGIGTPLLVRTSLSEAHTAATHLCAF